jgi:hypothetical protein
LKKNLTEYARDYLVKIIGHNTYKEALQIPATAPQVLLRDKFDVQDPLSRFGTALSTRKTSAILLNKLTSTPLP